jgi:hypothetical protein
MKPIPPVKPPDKLPPVDLLTMIAPPDDPTAFTVVLTRMRGAIIVKRKVLSPTYISKNEAFDEFQRLATRIFFFNEGEELLGGDE